ncbi:snRNA-activating protein of 50kDa MW C terminal-domain-containing protein [Cytidiella melzeri]|nr:snRNA-activating protein of 50kDa MW C terminal-domain-containing protein [Cytidiella melzeri]
MNIGQGQAYESYFGPASELVNVAQFLSSTAQSQHNTSSAASSAEHASSRKDWLALPGDRRQEIETECSIGDLQDQLHDVIRNPRTMAHIMRTHQILVESVLETADVSRRKSRKRTTFPAPDEGHIEVQPLQKKLDDIQLQSWPLTVNAALFIRPPKHADHNTLSETVRINVLCFDRASPQKPLAFGGVAEDSKQALLFVTVYNTLSWGHRQLSRLSQHVLLSSQSLGDLYDAIPCSCNEMPEKYVDEEGVTRWKDPEFGESTGVTICIEGVAYGDGQSEQDYSDKLLEHLKTLPSTSVSGVKKGPVMHDTTFQSLAVRLHKPYWLLHSGACEHFVVFENIRLHHVCDPPLSKYPLTTHITPPLLDTCRACSKAPSVYAVCGDIRLGESPFVICAPCWRWMGEPRGEDAHNVLVVPLPKHELGWGGCSS